MNIKPNGVAYVLAILITIVSIGIVCYLLLKYLSADPASVQNQAAYPTTTESLECDDPSWKTYDNNFVHPTYKFSLEVPEGWEVYVEGCSFVTHISSNDGLSIKIGTKYLYKHMSFEENAEEWKTYYFSSGAELGEYKKEILATENFRLEGKTGIRYIFNVSDEENGDTWKGVWAYLPFTEDKLLYIKYYSSNEKYDNKFDQILSTFKFISDDKNIIKQSVPSDLNTSCSSDADCRQYISSNNCMIYCANLNPNNNRVLNRLSVTCDSALWDPPGALNCGCIENNCHLYE